MTPLRSLLLLTCLLSLLHICSATYAVELTLNTTRVVYTVEPEFLSVTFDANSMPLDFDHVDFTNAGLVNMCKALQPVLLRWGGTEADWTFYAVNQTSDPTPAQIAAWTTLEENRVPDATKRPAEIMSYNAFLKFSNFINSVGWKMVFGLNALDRNADGSWDMENDLKMINLVKGNPEQFPIVGWEFGNEPDLYNREKVIVPASELVKDIVTLRSLVPADHFVVGWDVATPYWPIPPGLFYELAGEYVQSAPVDTIRAATLHFYYRHATPSNPNETPIEASVDPDVLDQLPTFVANATTIAGEQKFTRPFWLGESSSFSGGGALGVSNTFAAGFLWLDKLGLAPLLGIGMVFRQTMRSNDDSIPPMHYGLLGPDLSPNPDLFSSVLYKRLVGPEALDLGIIHAGGPVRTLRMYAHCSNPNVSSSLPSGTSKGAITLIYLNINKDQEFSALFSADLLPLLGSTRLEFNLRAHTLAPGANWTEILGSPDMNLNDVLLELNTDESLPDMQGLTAPSDKPLIFDHLSYGFIVYPNAMFPACGYTGEADEQDRKTQRIALE